MTVFIITETKYYKYIEYRARNNLHFVQNKQLLHITSNLFMWNEFVNGHSVKKVNLFKMNTFTV